VIVRTALNTLAAGFVLTGKALVAARLRSLPTGWRQAVGVALRGEQSKFAVSAFGLKVPAGDDALDFEARVATNLADFLRTEPEARYRLGHTYRTTRRVGTKHVDLVVQHFNPDGSLGRIEPHLAPIDADAPDPATREKVHAAIVAAYNRTRHAPEWKRPLELLTELRPATTGESALYAARLLGACCLSFEPLPAGRVRFAPPEFRTRRGLGFGFLAFDARPNTEDGTADVWTLAHHVGTDGVPLQELSSRLERAWGAVPVQFPEPDGELILAPRPCFVPGEREAYESVSFHDFGPLLALRKKLNAELGPRVDGDITLGCLLLWRLAQEPEFARQKFASTVDIAANGKCERDVDLVSLRPADYSPDEAGLVAYARAFNDLISSCRLRVSPVRKATQTASLLPAWLHAAILRSSPEVVRDTFGAVGLSVLRDAKVFVAPLSDIGFPDGFIAVGGVNLPTNGGTAVGAVSVKGKSAMAETYPQVIRRMLERCRGAIH
jgi:hypothetical protein